MAHGKPAAFRGGASAGAVFRHGLHYIGDVQRTSFLTGGNVKQASAAFRGEKSAPLWLVKLLRLDES